MISLLIVNYRSAALAAAAIRSARAASSAALQVVVVDNSTDSGEVAALREHADEVLGAPANLGYAGGINEGWRRCDGDVVVVANPDIVFASESIDRLAAALEDPRHAVAGPALFWDAAHRWTLPPADERTLRSKAGEVVASRSGVWAARRDRNRFRRRLAFWSLRAPTIVPSLSGAVMAIRKHDFERVRGFDTRFTLYFEETDFLRRIRRTGRDLVYVPSAKCRHIYNQSAGAVPDHATTAYAASELAYLSKWYGRGPAALLKRLERSPPHREYPPCVGPLRLPRSGLVVEVSPLATFDTAAGCFPDSDRVELPPEVWESYRGDTVYLRAVDPGTAKVVAACVRHGSEAQDVD